MKRTKILAANRVEAKYSYKFCEKGRFQGVRPKLPFESSLEVSVPMVAGIELKRYVNFNAGVDVSIVSPVGKISDFGFQFTPNLALSVLGKGPYVNPAILIGLSLGFVEIGVREKAYSFGEFKMGGVLGIAEDEVSKILFSMLWSRVPYKTDQEIVETFEGNGWEIGCNVVIPEEVIPEFTLPFVGTVDLRRWPIEYSYSKIKNGDGVEIKEHTFGIGYLLD